MKKCKSLLQVFPFSALLCLLACTPNTPPPKKASATKIMEKKAVLSLQLPQSRYLFRHFIDLTQPHLAPLLSLGLSHMMQNNYYQAESKFRQALKIDHKSMKAKIYLATLLATKDSKNRMEPALDFHPQDGFYR